MSDTPKESDFPAPPSTAIVRILPASGLPDVEDQTPPTPTPDETELHIPEEWDFLADRIIRKTGEDSTIEVHEEESDTGSLLTEVLEKRRWRPPLDDPALREAGTKGAKLPQDKPGHPKYDIDERILRAMALVGGTQPEIAAYFGCSTNVIQKRYGHIISEARASRKLRLRQKQYIRAVEDGSDTMLIWLGKQELGQFDESRMRVGDLNRFTDEELAQLAQGKVPGSLLGAGKKDGEDK